MGKKSREKRERREQKQSQLDLKKRYEASFPYNYERALASGKLVPASRDEVLNNPDDYSAVFVPYHEWGGFVEIISKDDNELFDPATVQYVMVGHVGMFSGCLVFTDSYASPEKRTLEYTCAIRRE
jgi:hypothetical protein